MSIQFDIPSQPTPPPGDARLVRLLEDTDEAYHQYTEMGGPMCGDYAEFASQSLNCFRRVLRNPELSREDLAWALRRTSRLRKAANEAGIPWTMIAAACLNGKNGLNGAND
jgi:hypothetical protein